MLGIINLQGFTRDLSLYLENQVPVGLFGSGVGLSLVLGFGAAYACYYLSVIAKRPQLVVGGEGLCNFLKHHCPAVTETYYPTLWCWEGRAQTLLRPFITVKPLVHYNNELIKTADGGQISLDWFNNDNNTLYPDASSRPTILLLPGLTGTSRESYILHMIKHSEALGYRCVVFNNRGVSGEDLLTPRTYCAANTEDLEAVIHHVHTMYSEAPLMAAGVSMGGMLLVNYLGKMGRQTPLKGAAVFSAGWEVFESAITLEKPINWMLFNYYLTTCLQASIVRMLLVNYLGKMGRQTPLKGAAVFPAGWEVFESAITLEKPINWMIFNYYLTTCLQDSIVRHRHVLEKQFDIDHILRAKSIREFDTRFTSVMFGYPTNDHYYKDACPCHRVKSVEIPMLCLNAMDDVFSPGHAIPVETAKQNPNVALVLTSYGGHIGFLEGIWPRKQTYMDRIFKQFVQAIFEHGNEINSM